jgi:N-acetylglucosamine kinase-like BadF-type ATPase
MSARRFVHLVVDGGGSATRAGLAHGRRILVRREGPSCNHRTHPRKLAAGHLAELIGRLWAERPPDVDGVAVACFALSSASTRSELDTVGDWLIRPALERAAIDAAQPWAMNDIVPLALAGDHDVAVVCGTGTGFAALGPAGWARASGAEYLLSDEGGGFDVGLRGLRAAVRAADGRGPSTRLEELASRWAGGSVPERLIARVHRGSRPKAVIASFAPHVMHAAEDGDAVASAIADAAADELLVGVSAVASRAGLTAESQIGYTGSLLTGPEGALRARLAKRVAAGRLWPIADAPLGPVAALAARLDEGSDALSRVPLAMRL